MHAYGAVEKWKLGKWAILPDLRIASKVKFWGSFSAADDVLCQVEGLDRPEIRMRKRPAAGSRSAGHSPSMRLAFVLQMSSDRLEFEIIVHTLS